MKRPLLSERKSEGFRTPYTTRYRVVTVNDEPSLTKQSFQDECDINRIMDKFTKTGVLNHVARHKERYGYATATDLREALDIIQEGQDMFDALPARVRKRFNHDPAEFLAFVQDNANYAEMADLGLLSEEATSTYLAAKRAAEAQNKASGGLGSDSDSVSDPAPLLT